MDYYTLKLRFGFDEEALKDRYLVKFPLPLDVGVSPILEYLENLSFTPKELSWGVLLNQGWRFILEPHPAGLCWIFLSPKLSARILHKEPIPLVGKYLKTADEYGMLPEWTAWKQAELTVPVE